MNVGYVHTFEVPENNIDKGRLKVSVVNEENVPIKGAAVRLSYTGNPDNIIGESGTDGDGISIFNDLRTPPIEYSMEPGNRQPFSEYDIAVSAPGFDNVNISGSDMFSGELSIQNVKMGADLANNHDFLQIIEDLGLGDKLDKYPSELSGGEQQRVSIARALAKKPEILFLDEPTGALDEETGRKILDYIWKLKEKLGFTLIMVTHNQNIADMARTIIRVNSGKITEVVTNDQPQTAYEIGW